MCSKKSSVSPIPEYAPMGGALIAHPARFAQGVLSIEVEIVQADEFLGLSTILVSPTSTVARLASFRPLVTLNDTSTSVLVEQTTIVEIEQTTIVDPERPAHDREPEPAKKSIMPNKLIFSNGNRTTEAYGSRCWLIAEMSHVD